MRSPARGAAMRGVEFTCGTMVVMASQKMVDYYRTVCGHDQLDGTRIRP